MDWAKVHNFSKKTRHTHRIIFFILTMELQLFISNEKITSHQTQLL